MTQQASVTDTIYVQAPIAVPVDTGHTFAQVALVAPAATPVAADWQPGVWSNVTIRGVDTLYAGLLVGPGGVAYLAGNYDLWAQTSDTTTLVARKYDTVTFF